jgi:hypothetical protein
MIYFKINNYQTKTEFFMQTIVILITYKTPEFHHDMLTNKNNT